VKQVENILKERNAHTVTFYEIGQHSPIAEIRRAGAMFKEQGCDGIVSVGGGSPVDASKAILYNIQLDFGGKTMPQIAIPTTLSAAEYTVRALELVIIRAMGTSLKPDLRRLELGSRMTRVTKWQSLPRIWHQLASCWTLN
jgi:alcohol dehydrogenase class IV